MTTLGPVVDSTIRINLGRIFDAAFRRCRLPAQAITSEMIDNAKDQLYFWLSELPNAGTPLAQQSKYLVGMNAGISSVSMPVGTVTVLNANLRTTNRFDGTDSASAGVAANAFDGDVSTVTTLASPGTLTTQFSEATKVTTIGILPGTTLSSVAVVIKSSPDGVTYSTAYSGTFNLVDSNWLWLDIEGATTVQYWRAEFTFTGSLDIRELYWGGNPNEIPVSPLNKDDYWSLPDKTFTGRPLQYWLDMQSRPVMNLWPAPDSASVFRQLVLLVHRYVLDISDLTAEIDMPRKWHNAVVENLALKLARTTPEVKMEVIPDIQQTAATALQLAWSGDSDSTTMRIGPDLSPYTA